MMRMRKQRSGLWIWLFRAFVAALAFGGSSLTPASGSRYNVPMSSVLIGPNVLRPGQTANYVVQVTFTDGGVLNFPPSHILARYVHFTSVRGSIDASSGAYIAPLLGSRDVVTASFAENGVITSASRLILLQ